MTALVEDDVKVWVAARRVALEKPEFTTQEILDSMQRSFKGDPKFDAKKMERFVSQQCVANAAGAGGKHYNYLFRLGPGKYRMFKTGDPIEFSHASAPTTPAVSAVPPEYKGLFSATTKFPAEVRPVGVAVKPVEKKPEPAGSGKRGTLATAVQAKPEPEIPSRGLKIDLAELDATIPSNLARKTIFELLFLELGKLGSRLESTKGDSFVINLEPHTGSAHMLQNLTLKLPSGAAISHQTDITLEVETPTRTLFIDIVEASTRSEEIKAKAFDAIHLRRDPKHRYSVIVFLRTPHGMLQEQAEAVTYGYDFFFGVDANDAKNPAKFYALKSHILQWIEGKVKRVDRTA